MTFQPIVPLSGVGGWALLKRTEETQKTAFADSVVVKRELAYFRENIANATTAKDLVGNPRLLNVALAAFGLEDEAYKKAFLIKMLDEGTETSGALSLKLVDPKYRKFVAAFGYGNTGGPQVGRSTFAESIEKKFIERQFEVAVGNKDQSLRMALNFRREITELSSSSVSGDAAWFSVMGNTPLRTVLQDVLGLPTKIATMDIDQQLQIFRDTSDRVLGIKEISEFKDPDVIENAINRYMAVSQAKSGPTASTPGYSAITLLSGQPLVNLLVSNKG